MLIHQVYKTILILLEQYFTGTLDKNNGGLSNYQKLCLCNFPPDYLFRSLDILYRYFFAL